MTPERIKEILDAHAKWLRGEDGGRRADLSRADLSDADLSGANLREANLRGANLSGTYLREANLNDAGQDKRGYRFWSWRNNDGEVVYRGGCREWIGIDAARDHYGEGYSSDGDVTECLARLDLLHILAKARGWIVEGAA